MAKKTIGAIGLGLMGSAISANLLSAGYRVIGFDILPERVDALAGKNGTPARSCSQVAECSDVVITSLPADAALKEVVKGPGGLLECPKAGLIVIETSTLSLEAKQEARNELEPAGVAVLDCPLSGTAAQAAEKDLVAFASGDRSAFERCIPVIEAFSRSHHYLGEFGLGSKMKFIANLLVAIHNVSAAEAIVLGEKAGLDPGMLYEVIKDGAGSSRMFEVRGPLMVAGNYGEATMKVDLFLKDIEIITAFARKLNAPTPLLSAAARVYETASKQGRDKQDTASVCAVLEAQAGIKKSR